MVGWRIALWAVILLTALAFLYMVRGVLLPFVCAFIVSMLLNPTIRKLRMRGFPSWAAVTTVFLGFSVLVVGLGILIAPRITAQLSNFRSELDKMSAQLKYKDPADNYFASWRPPNQAKYSGTTDRIDKVFAEYKPILERFGQPTTKKAFVEQYVDPHKEEIANWVQTFFNGFLGIVSSFASQLFFILITPILTLMILLDIENFKRRTASWIPPSIRSETIELISDIGNVFVRYLRGVTSAVLLYVVCASVLLTILGAPYSFLLALVFGAVYLIPFFGPMISYLILFLVTGLSQNTHILFLSFSTPWVCALVLTLIYIAYGLIFDQVIYPQLVGKSVGLNPVVSMFVIFSGGALFGVAGMILAFPIAGAVKIVLDRLLKFTTTPSAELGLPSVPIRHRESTA
jgi:predicted PurR-regulated permease PerM